MSKYLSMLDAPTVVEGEAGRGPSSQVLCPSLGIGRGLVSRHISVRDGRMLCICFWKSEAACLSYFDAEWHARADTLWGDRYQLQITAFETADAA
ncbi:hypothetical protein [Methylobacterium oryzisoli]|uniref:hypothetical protein n=1 Tax=Methylobacterium oryzisoli TaxID=3385502 RepID=UPI0038916F4E